MGYLTSVELFTGAGGLALATHAAGFAHSGLFEWNPNACDTLRKNARLGAIAGVGNWDSDLVQGDLSAASFLHHQGIDLLAGGPPCQPFSMGGKAQGMEDRRDMIPQFIRAVREGSSGILVVDAVGFFPR
jgi:DNA (cytosine-5)-methyltransferase 1